MIKRDFFVGAAVGIALGSATAVLWQSSVARQQEGARHPAGSMLESNAAARAAEAPDAAPRSGSLAGDPASRSNPFSLSVPPDESRARATQSAAVSVALPDEHAAMLSPKAQVPTLQELHAQFASELKDVNWAYGMERALRAFLESAGVDSGHEIIAVDCRTSLCEILAFGNVPESNRRWDATLSEMSKQAWWKGIEGNYTSIAQINGRAVIATILLRSNQ